MTARRSLALTALVLLPAFLLTAGCQKQEEIRVYTARKPHVVNEINPGVPKSSTDPAPAMPLPGAAQASGPARTLGAIVPHEGTDWFFKLTGSLEAVTAQADAFRAFVKTIKFEGDEPTWTVPEGWDQQPAAGMRFATLRISVDPPLELTVIPLPTGQGEQASVLANVNRWRQQLGQAAITAEELPKQTETLDLGGVQATIVDVIGRQDSSSSMLPPFARGRAQPAAPAPTPQASPIEYEAPDNWTALPASGFRKAAFRLTGEGEQKAEITVIDLPEAAGQLLPNVNRWREQIGLSAVTEEQLKPDVKQLQVDGITSDYVQLAGPESSEPRQSILGVVTRRADKVWFFKLQGDTALAEREREAFEQFVGSVRFQ